MAVSLSRRSWLQTSENLPTSVQLAVNSFVNPDFAKGAIIPNAKPWLSAFALGMPLRPARVDWSKKITMPVVRNQGNCFTCTSFATSTAIEAMHTIKYGGSLRLAPGFIHTCLFSWPCEQGLWAGDVLERVAASGVAKAFEGDYPYPPARCSNLDRYRIGAFERIVDEESAANVLISHGPIVCDMQVDAEFFALRKGQVYRYKPDPHPILHSLVVVGFDSVEKYWIVQNSYSEAWADGGYGYVAFGSGGILTTRAGFKIHV